MADPVIFAPSPALSWRQTVAAAASHLRRAGVENADREARLLVLAALNRSQADLILHGDMPVGQDAGRIAAFVMQRACRIPFARITGHREFFGLDFELSPATLVPRPDTETLVEAVLYHAKSRALDGLPSRILDLGTGSGAILGALLHALPKASGVGIDCAQGALVTARQNIERLIGPGRAQFLLGDWLAPVSGLFDIIVSNPPYIPTSELAALEPEVRDGDPLLALDGGSTGLSAYHRLATEVGAHLAPRGILGLEIGAGQAQQVTDLFAAAALTRIEARRDLGGHIRALVFEHHR